VAATATFSASATASFATSSAFVAEALFTGCAAVLLSAESTIP
jgi:hypothetical protein